MDSALSLSRYASRSTRTHRESRAAKWLLALAPTTYLPAVIVNVGFIAPVMSAHGVPAGVPFTEMTRSQMDAIFSSWVVFQLALTASSAFVLGAVILVARCLRATRGRRLAGISVAAAVTPLLLTIPYAVLGALALSFTSPTLGDDPRFAAAHVLGFVVFDLTLVALGCVGAALAATAMRPRLGWTVAGLSGVALVAALLAPLYAPPFVTALLASALGIGLLTGRAGAPRRSAARAASSIEQGNPPIE